MSLYFSAKSTFCMRLYFINWWERKESNLVPIRVTWFTAKRQPSVPTPKIVYTEIKPAWSSPWQRQQRRTHFSASRLTRSSDNDWPFAETLKSFTEGSKWWNVKFPMQRSYRHTLHFPPNCCTNWSLTVLRRSIVWLFRHRLHRKYPPTSSTCSVIPCFWQTLSIRFFMTNK